MLCTVIGVSEFEFSTPLFDTSDLDISSYLRRRAGQILSRVFLAIQRQVPFKLRRIDTFNMRRTCRWTERSFPEDWREMDPFTTMELLPAFQQVGQFWTLEDLKSLLTNSGELVRLDREPGWRRGAATAGIIGLPHVSDWRETQVFYSFSILQINLIIKEWETTHIHPTTFKSCLVWDKRELWNYFWKTLTMLHQKGCRSKGTMWTICRQAKFHHIGCTISTKLKQYKQ